MPPLVDSSDDEFPSPSFPYSFRHILLVESYLDHKARSIPIDPGFYRNHQCFKCLAEYAKDLRNLAMTSRQLGGKVADNRCLGSLLPWPELGMELLKNFDHTTKRLSSIMADGDEDSTKDSVETAATRHCL